MEIVDYYYKLLEINYDAPLNEINNSYSQKIKKYLYLPFLTDTQKNEIKELKKAKYILLNPDLKKIYDSVICTHFNENNKIKENKILKKDKIESNLVGDRIFSMVGILNLPHQNTSIDRSFSSTRDFR